MQSTNEDNSTVLKFSKKRFHLNNITVSFSFAQLLHYRPILFLLIFTCVTTNIFKYQ